MQKNYFNFNNSINYFFIVARGRYLNDICNIFGAISLNKQFKFQPILIKDNYPKNYFIFKYFGLKENKFIFSYYKIFNNLPLLLFSFINTFKCIYNLHLNGFAWLINEFSIKNIIIGDLIYDTYIRKDHRYTSPKIDLAFSNIIFKACYRTLKLEKLTQIYRPKLILIGTDGYAYNSGIMMRIGLKNKIKVYEIQAHCRLVEVQNFKKKFGSDHLRIIYKDKNYDLNKKKILNHYDYKKKNKNKIIPYLSTDTLYLANKNKYKNKKKIFSQLKINDEIKNYDKIILIASHAFSDAPHVTGYLIFRDFYNHMYDTLNFINHTKFDKNILWILKEHPASFLYKEKKIFKNLVNQFSSKKIILCPNNINTYDLIKICDNVITTRGSIGLEFAAEGKKPILGGAASYSHLGFTEDPKNKNQYFKILKDIHKIKPLKTKQIFEAKKAIYFLDSGFYNYKLKNSNIISQHRAKKNYYKSMLRGKISQNQNTTLNDTLKNLRNKDINNDPYYQSINNFFKNNILAK